MKGKINYLWMLCSLLLLFGVSDLYADHGGPHYYKGKAIVHNEADGSGKVYVSFDNVEVDINNIPEEAWQEVSSETSLGECSDSEDGSDHYNVIFCAKPDAGSYFWGWYPTEECNLETATSVKYQTSQYYTGGSDTEPTVGTLYAKFSTEPIYHYNISVRVQSEDAAKGMTGADTYSGVYMSYCHPESTKELRTVMSTETSAPNTAYVGAFPTRGHLFDRWTIVSDAGVVLADGYSLTDSETSFIITATNEMGNARGDVDFTGVVQASFTDLTPFNVTVQKKAGKGTVVGTWQYIGVTEGGDGIEYKYPSYTMAEADVSYDYESYAGDMLTLEAIPVGTNKFYGWYKVEGSKKTLVSTETTIEIYPEEATTYFAYFDDLSMANFRVGFSTCQTFEQALAAAADSDDKTILLLKNYEISTPGYYTIPAGVTLLIPYKEDQISPDTIITRISTNDVPTSAYRTFTLASGVHLNVYGTIEVGGCQTTSVQSSGGDKGQGRPGAPTYGHLIMNETSTITLNNGALLRAWGYVTGAGTIDARRGSVVREHFQIMDWKGGTCSLNMVDNEYKVFQVTQYYIQNVEVPTTYHPGAKLFGSTAMNMKYVGVVQADNVGIIGAEYKTKKDSAMFLMNDEDDSEDTWVRKWYDIEQDKQVYEVNNSAKLGSLIFNMYATMDSRAYVLPITNNMKIHLLSGRLGITQDTELLPGAEIEVDKKSTVVVESAQTLYLYDAANWGNYVRGTTNGSDDVFVYAATVKWRPGGKPNVRTLTADGLGSAKLNIHGTLEIEANAALKTTDGGASIISTIGDAGTITFGSVAPAVLDEDYIWQTNSTGPNYVSNHVVPALLRNDATSKYGATTSTALAPAKSSYCFIDIDGDGRGEWISLTDDEDLCMTHDQNGIYYIKPGAYVPISVGEPSPEADNTYRDHYAGTDSIYIVTGECQWWCVYPVEGHPDLFECKHKDNHTFYYYDEDKGWIEKKFKVEWVNWNGDPVKYWPAEGRSGHPEDSLNYYMMTYGSHPQWLSANPTHPEDDAHTYAFSGWSPAITEETIVTSDITYTATFEERDRMYAISFLDSDDDLIELVYCKLGDVPTCSRYTLQETETTKEVWSPAIGAVTKNGTRTYKVTEIDKEETGPFTILFVNWDGTSLQKFDGVDNDKVVKNANPVYTESDPTKVVEGDILHTYTFVGWKAVDGTVYAKNETLPAAITDATYTANFTQSEKEYTIKFYKKDGTTRVGEPQSVKYGVVPTEPSSELIWYFKEGTEWDSTLVWSPLVSAVTANQNYTATYTRKKHQYTVNWVDGNGTTIATDYVDYGATPAYSGLTPEKASDDTYAYIFTGDWNTAPNGSGTGIVAVSDNATYYAQFNGNIRAVTVSSNESADEDKAFETLTITTIGQLDMGSNKLKVDELILKANETTSGQLKGSNVTATNAYYDIKFTNGERRHWHAFGVPWQVNLDTDPLREVETGRIFVLGRDYDIIYYNGAKRAANGQGANCWEYVEHNSHILQPGQGYMIAFTSDVQTIRFAKKAYAPVVFSGTVNVPANAGGEATNNGINAIANPMTYYASLSVAGVGQVHDGGEIGHDGYTEYNLSDPFVVGKAVFVQVTSGQTLTPSSGISPAAAPARRAAKATDKEYLSLNDFYTVSLTNANSQEAKVYVLPEEDKEDEYVIGHDLVKMGMSDRKAQIWVNRYDVKLGLNTTAPEDGVAEFPVNIYAPKAGQYTLSLVSEPDDEYAVYLTQNGEAIWNLSSSGYAVELAAGTNKSYGLRLSARKSPSVATGTDEALVDAQGETKKVLINDQVFIIRGDQVYSIDGQLVK